MTDFLPWPPVVSAPIPPSVPGIEQPVMEGADPPTFPEFTPVFPPPPVGSVEISVAAVVNPNSGPEYDYLVTEGDFPYDFPDFSTTFPTPPVTFANLMMIGDDQPPIIVTTQNVFEGGWGPPGPQPPPTPGPTPPDLEPGESEGDYMIRCVAEMMDQGVDETEATTACEQAYIDQTEVGGRHARAVHNGDTEPVERRAGSVLQSPDTNQLRQSESKTDRRRKRMSAGGAKRHKH